MTLIQSITINWVTDKVVTYRLCEPLQWIFPLRIHIYAHIIFDLYLNPGSVT